MIEPMQAGYFLLLPLGDTEMTTKHTTSSLLAVIFVLGLGAPSGAAERDALRYAQASPPADTAAPPAAAPPAAATPAAPAPAAAPPPAAAAPAASAPAAKLVGLQAWSALVGNSISGMEDGKPLVEHYLADGTAKSMTGNEISTGNWALVGETVCFKYDNETECYKIEVMDKTATFTDSKGTGPRYEILKGNPKNL
jgi:pyruvate/2-oxoglutarate dehydrogenase complex dihydrolipoamide acyltransferase (E2) component